MQDSAWPRPMAEATFVPLQWPPPPAQVAPRPRRWVYRLAILALVTVAAGAGVVAWRDERSATQWRNLERRQAALAAAAQGQTRTANLSIRRLDSQMASLDEQLTSAQGQLSSVADQKEKAVDAETVLQTLLSDAAQVADDLQQCIDATNHFDSDLNGAVATGDLSQFSSLQNEATAATNTCNQAESANQNLQSAIAAGP